MFASFHQSRDHAQRARSENPEAWSKCHLRSAASGWAIRPGVNDTLQVQRRLMCRLRRRCGLMLSFPKTVETLVAGNLRGRGLPADGALHTAHHHDRLRLYENT